MAKLANGWKIKVKGNIRRIKYIQGGTDGEINEKSGAKTEIKQNKFGRKQTTNNPP